MNYNLKDYDEHGWAHIHHASYRGYVKSIDKFCQADKSQLEYETSDALHLTPILVAVLGGRPDAVEALVKLGAKVDTVDARGHGVVELAALGENVEILSYFLRNPKDGLNVWARMLQLVSSDPIVEEELEAVTVCIRELIDPDGRFSDPVVNPESIVEEGFVPVLVRALRITASNVAKESILHIIRLLLMIGKTGGAEDEGPEVKDLRGLVRSSAFECGIVTILIRQLKSSSSSIVQFSAELLRYLCHTQEYASDAYDKGAIPALIGALQNTSSDSVTLVEVVEALGTIVGGNPVYQSSLGRIQGAVEDMLRLYDRTSDRVFLLSLTSVVVKVVRSHEENQRRFVDAGVATSLIGLLRGRNKDLQGAGVEAVHRLSEDNPEAQRRLKESGIVGPLLGTLSKLRQPSIQQTIARALWSIAGEDLRDLHEMSHRIGSRQLIEFLTSFSEDLQFIGSEALGILSRLSSVEQDTPLDSSTPRNQPTRITPRSQLTQGTTLIQDGQRTFPRIQSTTPRTNGTTPRIQGTSPRTHSTTPRIQGTSPRTHSTTQRIYDTSPRTQGTSQPVQGTESAVPPLVRLLGSPQEKIVLSVIRTLRYLSVRSGYVPQPANQTALGQARGLKLLVAIMVHASNPLLQVEAAFTIACASLGHQENTDELLQNADFSYSRIIRMLYSTSSTDEVRLLAGSALAAFAFKNTLSQKAIGGQERGRGGGGGEGGGGGGLSFSCFLSFLRSNDQLHRCHAAFQVVVLSPVITDVEAAISSAAGIRLIVDLLQTSTDDEVLSLAADCVARLAHTRVGISGAFVSIDVVSYLCSLLLSRTEHVRNNAIIALGYLSYHHDAKRQILARCRRMPIIMKVLKSMSNNKMSEELLKEWRHFEQIGLPAIEIGPRKAVANADMKRQRRKAQPAINQ